MVPSPSDDELLRRYATAGDQDAFRQLVGRHVHLVYSVAVRLCRDRHLADDVTQSVFIVLSKKAGRIREGTILASWLFGATRYAAANALRVAGRRRRHERDGGVMRYQAKCSEAAAAASADEGPWAAVAPLLDAALAVLGRREREAVLLRYLAGRSHHDVAAALGVSEEAARKRVSRGLERLREFFRRRGVNLTAAAIAATCATHAVQAAPLAVVESACGVGSGAVAAAAVQGVAAATLKAMVWAKAKLILVATLGVLFAGSVAAVAVRSDADRAASPVPKVGATPIPAAATGASAAALKGADLAAAKAARTIAGTIRGPDGAPLAGAELFLAAKGSIVDVYGDRWPAGTAVTGPDATFSMAAPDQPWVLVVRHRVGFAQVSREEYAAAGGGDVVLAPWGRVDGRLMVGSRPRSGWSVQLCRLDAGNRWPSLAIRYDRVVDTDADGRFVFDRVAPGESWVSHANGRKPRPGGQVMHDRQMTMVDVEPGKTTTVQVGGTGTPVVGRLALTVEGQRDFRIVPRNDADHFFNARFNRTDLRGRPRDPDADRLTPEQAEERFQQWARTPAGKAFRRDNWAEPFDVAADGTFRIEDVRPGEYTLWFSYQVREGRQFGPALVDAAAEFTVPATPGRRGDQPVDVGTVRPTLRPRLTAGTPAPDFEAFAVADDTPFKLSDLRGTYVLLVFWWNWTKPGELGAVERKVSEMAARAGVELSIVNLTFDDVSRAGKRQLVEKGIPGRHGYVKGTGLGAYTSATCAAVLVDPHGDVRAPRLDLENIETEVAKLLLELDDAGARGGL
jgi:RNA polymerase sigma factor (sigma-70 family)